MKIILALSLLVCAIQALQWNGQEYGAGLADQLGFTSAQEQEAANCYSIGYQIYEDVQNLIAARSQGSAEILSATIQLITDLNTDVQDGCEPFIATLKNYFVQNTEGNANQVMLANLKQYIPQLIQEFATWADNLATGNDYAAGQTDAYILQILLGVEQPTVLPVPQATSYVPYDASTFYNEFFPVFVNAFFGTTNETIINNFVTCSMAINNLTMDIIQFQQQLSQSTGIVNDLSIVQNIVDTVFSIGETCYETTVFEIQMSVPLWETFKAAPLQTISALAYNVASNLPELIQENQELAVAVIEGNYTLAGQIQAQSELTIMNGFPMTSLTN